MTQAPARDWSPQQFAALATVEAWFTAENGPQVFKLFGYAGTGKTTLAIEIANRVRAIVKERQGELSVNPVLFAAFTGKAALVMRHKGCHGASTLHGLIYRVEEEAGGGTPKFVLKEDSGLADAALLIIDECFAKGTLVDTPIGPTSIETLRPGQLILNAYGVDRIVAVSKKAADHVAVVHVGETQIRCSEGHRFFTRRGLVSASELRPGDELCETSSAMRLLQHGVHAEGDGACPILLNELRIALVPSAAGVSSENLYAGARCQVRRGAPTVAEFGDAEGASGNQALCGAPADAIRLHESEDQRGTTQDRASPGSEGRKRTWPDKAANITRGLPWSRVEDGVCSANQCSPPQDAGSLQTGYCASGAEDCHRSRWRHPSRGEGQICGPTQGSLPAFQRVDRVEVLEWRDSRLDQLRASDGRVYLYDLQAARHSSFGVHGLLVHNCSMVGAELATDVLSFRKKVLVLGDPAQLPPVDDAGYFTNGKPDVMLTEVHRQAAGNPIIRLSMDVREGRHLEPGDYGACRIMRRGTDADVIRALILSADQVLVGRNDTRTAYNARIRDLLNFRGDPKKGERLVCLRNDHTKGILNGGLFRVEKVRKANAAMLRLVIKHDDAESERKIDVKVHPYFFHGGDAEPEWQDLKRTQRLTYGYALTVHKSQGSQWNNVVLFDESGVFREDARRWLYTGITRAAERLTVVM